MPHEGVGIRSSDAANRYRHCGDAKQLPVVARTLFALAIPLALPFAIGGLPLADGAGLPVRAIRRPGRLENAWAATVIRSLA